MLDFRLLGSSRRKQVWFFSEGMFNNSICIELGRIGILFSGGRDGLMG